jgi:K+/H+ antiporter YhaU regulatory subunit KhtT
VCGAENIGLAGRTIGELKIGEKTDAIVLAFRMAEGRFDTTPSAGNRLHAGDTLIVLGSRDQTTLLEQLIRGKEASEE